MRRVARLAPDHVGFSATTISVHNAGLIAPRLKALVPGIVTTVDLIARLDAGATTAPHRWRAS